MNMGSMFPVKRPFNNCFQNEYGMKFGNAACVSNYNIRLLGQVNRLRLSQGIF